jgi:hypothetical protein
MQTEETTFTAVLIQPNKRTEPQPNMPVINYYFVYIGLPKFESPPIFNPSSYTPAEGEDEGILTLDYSAGAQQEGSQLYLYPFIKQYLFNEGNPIDLTDNQLSIKGKGDPAPPNKTGKIRVAKTVSLYDGDELDEKPRVCVIPGGDSNYCIIVLCRTTTDHAKLMHLNGPLEPDTIKFSFTSGSGSTESDYIAAMGYVFVDEGDLDEYKYVQVGDLAPISIPAPISIGSL